MTSLKILFVEDENFDQRGGNKFFDDLQKKITGLENNPITSVDVFSQDDNGSWFPRMIMEITEGDAPNWHNWVNDDLIATVKSRITNSVDNTIVFCDFNLTKFACITVEDREYFPEILASINDSVAPKKVCFVLYTSKTPADARELLDELKLRSEEWENICFYQHLLTLPQNSPGNMREIMTCVRDIWSKIMLTRGNAKNE